MLMGMTNDENVQELIKEARVYHTRLEGDTNACAVDDDDWPCMTRRLADALEATEADAARRRMFAPLADTEAAK